MPDVIELIEPIFFEVSGFVVPGTETKVAGGHQRIGVGIRQLIAGFTGGAFR